RDPFNCTTACDNLAHFSSKMSRNSFRDGQSAMQLLVMLGGTEGIEHLHRLFLTPSVELRKMYRFSQVPPLLSILGPRTPIGEVTHHKLLGEAWARAIEGSG